MLDGMTLDQLRALAAVVDKGGFRPAADTLFKSQSAVSIAIRKLEEELGIRLFDRDAYRPTLTREGSAIYEKAKSLLDHAGELNDMARHFAVGEEPELGIAMSSIVPIDAPLSVFNTIIESHPATRLALLVETLNGTMERLDDGDADFAIAEVFEQSGDYVYADLMQVEMVNVIAPCSRLAGRAATLTKRDMEGTTQIIVRDSSRHSAKRSAGIVEGTRHWVVSDFTTKKRIIASGIGWGGMPAHMIREELERGELIALSGEEFRPMKAEIKAVRKKDKPLGPVATELWQQLQNIDWS